MSIKCVFDASKECPVRKEMKATVGNKKELDIDKIVKPLGGDIEFLKIYAPIMDKMAEMLNREFGVLHYYCETCRMTVPCP